MRRDRILSARDGWTLKRVEARGDEATLHIAGDEEENRRNARPSLVGGDKFIRRAA